MDPHRLAEERSLAYHALIAARLDDDARLLARARAKLTAWRTDPPMSADYVRAWSAALDGPRDALRALLLDPSEHGRAMRQTTPFAGALSAEERWRIFREVGAAVR